MFIFRVENASLEGCMYDYSSLLFVYMIC
jgi:hypothetical protein